MRSEDITVVSCVCVSVCLSVNYYEISEVVCLEIETKVPTRHKLHALSNNCVKFYENPSFKIYGVIYTYANLEGLCQFEQVLLYTSTHTESYW